MTGFILRAIALCGLLCLACLVPGAGAEGAKATAEVDASEVFLGQSLILRVLVSGDAPAGVDMPELADCTVTPRGKGHGVRGDDRELVVAYRFELTPRRVGECRVPALSVTVGGETLATQPLAVRVLPRPVPPKGLAGRDLFVDAVVSPDTPYAGQAVSYTVRLYRAVAVSTITVSPPDVAQATLTPLPGQRDGEIEAAGRRYAVTEVAYRLTARQAGPLAVPPATAVFRDVAAKNGPSRDVTVAGPGIDVNVRPLPPYDGPTPFQGLVGRMELAARLRDDAASGRDAVYVLTLSGRGNLHEAGPPTLSLPPGLTARLLPPEAGQGEGTASEKDAREKVFRYALTADGPGEYVVPGPRLPVFDPEAGRYHVVAGPQVTLRVGAPPPDPALAPPLRHVSEGPGDLPPPWPWRLGLALSPVALYGLARFLSGPDRRGKGAAAAPAGPTALAEALRRALARTPRQDAAWSEGKEALGRLDALLYGGEPAGTAELEATADRAGQALRRLRP